MSPELKAIIIVVMLAVAIGTVFGLIAGITIGTL